MTSGRAGRRSEAHCLAAARAAVTVLHRCDEHPSATDRPASLVTQLLQSAAGLLALMRLPRVGAATAVAYARGDKPTDALDPEALHQAFEDADRVIEANRSAGVHVAGFFDDDFPSGLRDIPAAPAVVFYRGAPEAWAAPAIAVVGTRKPTSFGVTATRSLTTEAARAGFSVISGLALGVDGIAHEAALDSGGRTTAVLGSGVDTVTPRQHQRLADRILEAGGALLSEQPLGTEPSPHSLVARNRLQAGLAGALLVGQTGVKGGTMHTVRFAAEQGKPVFCPVPHKPTDESAGLVALLERPAAELPSLLPAWGKAGALARRLGDAPVARPVRSDGVEDWIAGLRRDLNRAAAPPPDGEEDGQLPLQGF
jgi:DNA processing protein